MSSILRFAPAKLALLGCLAATSAFADFDKTKWSNRALISTDSVPGDGLVEFTLTPETLDAARGDLADLRVVDADGRETAFIQCLARSTTRSVPLPVKLYNHTYLPGKESSVTVDFGSKVLKNSITVTTPGTSFRRRLAIEAGDDGQNWKKVREDAFLFRVPPAQGEGTAYDRKVVVFPDSDHRYVRLTVYNAPDDPERVEIQDVAAERNVVEPGETVSIPAGISVSNENQTTWMDIDAGHKNLPLLSVTLACGDANFLRRVSIYGRYAQKQVVEIKGEDGVVSGRTVDEPWQAIARDALYRYSAGGADESLVLDLRDAKYRYIRVGIHNADDPPLRDLGVTSLLARVHRVAFQGGKNTSYFLYFGSPAARAPEYDIVHYAGRLRAESVTRTTLGRISANPDFGRTSELAPWSERHKTVLWAALLAIVIVLGLLVFRQLKALPR